ncbi:MAG: hypothetical protein KJP25_07520, partial [Gammaproteobacteria bacterium]|nr:hypothetical protein [Gammaproteobacteria bacterium]
LVVQACACGFSSLELGGGQSFQIALQRGYNPYRILRQAKAVIDEQGNAMPLQILLRGANQFGFHHFSPALQQRNIDLLRDCAGDADKSRALIVRNFDALNDAENLRFSVEYMAASDADANKHNDALLAAGKPAVHKRLHLQVALSYVRPQSNASDASYSTRYYVNYAQRLLEIASAAGGSVDSICIKDMSSQLTPARAQELVPALQALGVPVVLHCHSTDEARATAVQAVAVECGIAGIEVAVEPLSGGASHNDIQTIASLRGVQRFNIEQLDSLRTLCQRIFSEEASSRKDFAIQIGSLKQLIEAGIPGGAIPFVAHDLSTYVCGMLGVELPEAIGLFQQELLALQAQLGGVPLVTPTADIISKQVIKALCNSARAGQYRTMDPRFCALVLGHYGWLVNHADGARIAPTQALVDDVQQYCAAIALDDDGLRTHAGRVYPEPESLQQHPTKGKAPQGDTELVEAQEYFSDLFQRYPHSCENFGSESECVLMHVMRPAGKSDRLITQSILRPTEARLRALLDATLHLLPQRTIPESRELHGDEETDLALLRALGDYDGIVGNIKDLVLTGETTDLKARLGILMNNIIEPLCQANEDMQAHRFYVERRFVALFAAAVFWDLQRICRRTGADSRRDIREITATRLERIISTTLRRRQRKGLGRAQDFLG